ncbi:MAG: O-antigen ligase family protein, partial [Acidobacteriota bacterium]
MPQPLGNETHRSPAEHLCEGLIEAGWLVALIVIPLHFNVYSNTSFEPDKAVMLRSLALLMLGAWAVKLLLGGWTRPSGGVHSLVKQPLVLATFATVASFTASTIFSLAPRLSWLGSYDRQQGALTAFCTFALFFLILGHFRTQAQWRRMASAISLTSLPIAVYAIAQRWGVDPVAQQLGLDASAHWSGAGARSSSTLGNPIFLGAYLILAIFVSLERLLGGWRHPLPGVSRQASRSAGAPDSKASGLSDRLLGGFGRQVGITARLRIGLFGALVALQLVALVATQSRGPMLALLAGLFFFSLLGAPLVRRRASSIAGARTQEPVQQTTARMPGPVWWAWILPLLVGSICVLYLSSAVFLDTHLLGAGQIASIGRPGTTLDFGGGTTQARLLLWQGIWELLSSRGHAAAASGGPPGSSRWRLFLGSGPETLRLVFGRFYPPRLARFEDWRTVPDRAHNQTFGVLVDRGVLGLAAYLALYISIFYGSLRWLGLLRPRKDRNLFALLLAAGSAVGLVAPHLLTGSWSLAGVGL